MKKSVHILQAILAFCANQFQTHIPLQITISINHIHFYFSDCTKQFFIVRNTILIDYNGRKCMNQLYA